MKNKCEHETIVLIRDLKLMTQVSQCDECGRAWRDGGRKFRTEFKQKEDENGG